MTAAGASWGGGYARGAVSLEPVTLQLFDTATREQRDFVPVTPGRVGMYICGLTTVSYTHLTLPTNREV